MSDLIKWRSFSELDLSDKFFDSLKEDYLEFESWFLRKHDKKALVFEENNRLVAFLYLKIEQEELDDIVPLRPAAKRLKVGTFKIEAHGTRLGERYIKKLFDFAIKKEVEEIYVTIFPKHTGLIRLFKAFGFKKLGTKTTHNGQEDVYVRVWNEFQGQILKDFPFFSVKNNRKFLLSIYPKFHTRLFADSILKNESYSIVQDLSHTNSIHKIYISWMRDLHQLNKGDLVIIYRTSDQPGRARFRSVATSVCTILETKNANEFSSIEEYIKYSAKYSVFNEIELRSFWPKSPTVIKMVYNAAFSRRVIRNTLLEDIGLDESAYWGFLELSDSQFQNIVELGEVGNIIK